MSNLDDENNSDLSGVSSDDNGDNTVALSSIKDEYTLSSHSDSKFNEKLR
eukprot:CAMPEP_0176340682 /NCGR_PEP_ID=MMETSP0126-20121128/1763_1 /TAXON_ID=141414 ORGANISM="Strombidinopsis acuminatum, Strain SPMC142" /NCGR_SAMPLE_ID=MMETSP0126 /ASSEMBLY_ACC=CAM_ASM_000229 /LENGTH=49 /DNA_ID=CAMNT_0017685025 /DNA_START=1752 /DNA_END=1901 /DNA_ORIENTATION=-